ncbi:MAG: hypothetical protein ACYC6Z_10630 [Thermoleophilia bacterium]
MESGTYLGANGSKEDTIIRGKITNAHMASAGSGAPVPSARRKLPYLRRLALPLLAAVLVFAGVAWFGASRAMAGSLWTEDWATVPQLPSIPTQTQPPTDKWNFHTYNLYHDPANPGLAPSTDSFRATTSPAPPPGGAAIPTLILQGNAWGLESKQHFQQGAPISIESTVKLDTLVTPGTQSLAEVTVYDGESGKYEGISLEDHLNYDDEDNIANRGISNLKIYRRTEQTVTPLNDGGGLINDNLDPSHFYKLRIEYDGRGTWRYYAYDTTTDQGGLLYSVSSRYQDSAPNIFILGVAMGWNPAGCGGGGCWEERLGSPNYKVRAYFQTITMQANYNIFSDTSWVDFLSTDNTHVNTDTNNTGCPWYQPADNPLADWPQCDYIQLAHDPPTDFSAPFFISPESSASGSVYSPVISRADPANQTWGEVLFTTAMGGAGTDLNIQVIDPVTGHPISESDLPGNSMGFRSSPIRLSWLDVAKYPTIKLSANLSTTNPAVTPKLLDWTLTFGKRNYFSWYDMQSAGMKDWLLMSNAAIYSTSTHFQTQLGAPGVGPSTYNVANPGTSSIQTFPGYMDGPLMVNALSGLPQVISQRVLFGDSLEETLAIPQDKISDKYYWTWYDMQTPGYKDWIVISNPDYTSPVYYEIRMPGVDPDTTPGAKGTIAPGGRATPVFPGVIGGSVEVQAWKDSSKLTGPANVIASQRVLMFGDTAFNEVNGIPASDLKDHYLWTWYDQKSPDAKNWVLVANPSTGSTVNYQISIAGGCTDGDASRCLSGTLQPAGDPEGRDRVTPTFPGVMGGPVEVTADGNVIASQRTLWDSSFEEVPGFPDVSTPSQSLASDYHWTWYDNYSAGSKNWVVVTNPNTESVNVQVLVAGTVRGTYGLLPNGGMTTPFYPGVIGGPVEVRAYFTGGSYANAADRRKVLASQRVLWNNHMNEVLGTVLDP